MTALALSSIASNLAGAIFGPATFIVAVYAARKARRAKGVIKAAVTAQLNARHAHARAAERNFLADYYSRFPERRPVTREGILA